MPGFASGKASKVLFPNTKVPARQLSRNSLILLPSFDSSGYGMLPVFNDVHSSAPSTATILNSTLHTSESFGSLIRPVQFFQIKHDPLTQELSGRNTAQSNGVGGNRPSGRLVLPLYPLKSAIHVSKVSPVSAAFRRLASSVYLSGSLSPCKFVPFAPDRRCHQGPLTVRHLRRGRIAP